MARGLPWAGGILYTDVAGVRASVKYVCARVVSKLRWLFSPVLVASVCHSILRWGSPFTALIGFMRDRYGRVYTPLVLTREYNVFTGVARSMRDLVDFRENPVYHRQARLLDKGAFEEVRLGGEPVPVERVPVHSLSLRALRVIVKSVVPLRASDYEGPEQWLLTALCRAGYLVREARGQTVRYYAPRRVYVEAVEELRARWRQAKSSMYGYLLDIALIQYGRRGDARYIRHKTVTSDDVVRLLRTYSAFRRLPVAIVDDEYLGELLALALRNPRAITVGCGVARG